MNKKFKPLVRQEIRQKLPNEKENKVFTHEKIKQHFCRDLCSTVKTLHTFYKMFQSDVKLVINDKKYTNLFFVKVKDNKNEIRNKFFFGWKKFNEFYEKNKNQIVSADVFYISADYHKKFESEQEFKNYMQYLKVLKAVASFDAKASNQKLRKNDKSSDKNLEMNTQKIENDVVEKDFELAKNFLTEQNPIV